MKTLALAAATAALAATATPALAGPAEYPVEKVSVAGLDLDSPEGQKMLDQRINRAAKKVCRVADIRTGTRLRSSEVSKCYAKAKASAKSQVASILAERRLGG
ncbi:UrcA family protein [Erythrobacter sp. THAF29]|uniref:UrcA family protein n=1 Tax=Erythrobacter sp. THAF29 TaxID=2587851 RepID=UPI0012A848CE|nr:UrcA family protein [Erythrobacter sp. THAF29]QFT76395.1 hypothetical protein FIU90_02450 [Erythrobacter sp. THAF29]